MISLVKVSIDQIAQQNVLEVLKSGQIASGKHVQELEKQFASYLGIKETLATNNGTSALHTALAALKLEKATKIITTPFSFVATANSILMNNCIPVFADIEMKSLNLDANKVEDKLKINSTIRAILLVHLFGMPCEIEDFIFLKNKYGVLLIEDCAQAHGALYQNQKIGSWGDVSAFSFYASKNLPIGEGGICGFNNVEYFNRAKKFINHGRINQYDYDSLGYNYRLTNIQAAIGLRNLELLDTYNAKRLNNATQYNTLLKKYCDCPQYSSRVLPVFYQYTIKVEEECRDKLQQHLKEKGIESAIIYPMPLYKHEHLKQYSLESLENTEKACKTVLSIPVHPFLTKEEIEIVAQAIIEFRS